MAVDYHYQTLFAITQAVNSLAPDVVLHNLVESTTKAVGAKACSLMLFTPDRKQLVHAVSYGLSSDYLEKGPVRSDAIIDQVLRGNAIAIPDVAQDARIQYKDQAKREQITSTVSIPLGSADEVVGIMRVYTSERREFSTEDTDFLRCLANIGAIALQKATVHEALGKALEERCREIARMEEERNRFLRFLSVAAHDLKAPLAAIQSYFGVMLGGFSGELNEKQRGMIERSSLRITELLNLISNLLDIPRIETGQLVQEMKECSLCDVILRCVAEMRPLATQKKLELRTDVPSNLCPIYGSATRLQQVLTNLVSNSINYTAEGEVLVRAVEIEQDVCVEVIDTGIGIPPQDIPNIFTDFFRGSNVTSKGTGLGLSIAKRIVEAHDGKMYCESPCLETGKGTRFSFVLPKRQRVAGRQAG